MVYLIHLLMDIVGGRPKITMEGVQSWPILQFAFSYTPTIYMYIYYVRSEHLKQLIKIIQNIVLLRPFPEILERKNMHLSQHGPVWFLLLNFS